MKIKVSISYILVLVLISGVLQVFAAGDKSEGLVFYYDYSEINNGKVADQSGNSYDGEIEGNIKIVEDPERGKVAPKSDFIFDLHNTTAATGVALMVPYDDKFAIEIGAYLTSLDPTVKIILWSNVPDWPMFASVGRSGMTFEVGPASWGCIAPAEFIQSKRLILSALDYIEAHNQHITQSNTSPLLGQKKDACMKIEVFQNMHYVKYPRDDNGELIGMIHPKLQWQDFKELKDGQPVFAMLDGSNDILFDSSKYESGAVYPFFINEAAYYEKDIAFMLARKVKVDVKIPILKSKI